MNTEDCFIIGNGESRNIFGDLMRLKEAGTVYGCNAIYRDYPLLCDKIFAANQSMYEEVVEGKKNKNFPAEIIGPDVIANYSYKVEGDPPYPMPKGLKIYRVWKGGDNKRKKTRTIDLSTARGSGMSAVYHAAEKGFKNIFIIAFDMNGDQICSKKFSDLIFNNQESDKTITFVIGGSFGLSSEIKDNSNKVLSASLFTFPHRLFRLILVEQIYRAHTIVNNMPYHK